jgi:hypothetical protein
MPRACQSRLEFSFECHIRVRLCSSLQSFSRSRYQLLRRLVLSPRGPLQYFSAPQWTHDQAQRIFTTRLHALQNSDRADGIPTRDGCCPLVAGKGSLPVTFEGGAIIAVLFSVCTVTVIQTVASVWAHVLAIKSS